MPIKSAKQYRLMQMAAHSKKPTSIGPSPAVAREMISKTPKEQRKKFARSK